MSYVFQSNALLYNQVSEEFKQLRNLEQLKEKEPTKVKGILKESQQNLTHSLDELALICNYSKMKDFCFPAFSAEEGKDSIYNVFYKENSGICDLLILKENGSKEPVHISQVPKKFLKKAVKYSSMHMQDNYTTISGSAVLFPAMLFGLSTVISLFVHESLNLEFQDSLVEFLSSGGIGLVLVGTLFGSGLVCAYDNIKGIFTKKKVDKFIEKHKDQNLISYGEQALEKIIT